MVAMLANSSETTQQNTLTRILIVDDEEFNCLLLERVLKSSHQVTTVFDGKAALEILHQETFDVVLLDIMMPVISGLDVLDTIRNTPEMSDLPVILVSALSDIEDVVRGLQMGANDYLAKPVDIDILSARVNTQIMLKRLLDERKHTIAELQATQEMKDRLLRMASHDLKAPLANIRMAEFLLRDVIGDDTEGNDILDMVMTTVSSMQDVIEDFLDTAPLRNGQIELRLEDTAVEPAVMNVKQQFNLAANNKNIHIEVGNLPGRVLADPTRLNQVITNLVSNAIKYSPSDTVVSLWSEHLGDQVRINVADQGPGIPANERHKLFTEFGKLTPRPTANESSTGLGLWNVKQLILLHNGQVGVDCPPDGGSVFWVNLPVSTIG
jgi:signal transduction histidine kinase